MDDLQQYLSRFTPDTVPVAPAQPVAPVSPDAAQLAAIRQDPNAIASVNLGMDRGNESINQNQIFADYQTMDPAAFAMKHGAAVTQQMAQIAAGQQEITSLKYDQRGLGERARDIGVGVGSGAIQSLGGIAGMIAAPISADAGRAIATGLDATQDFTNSLQSGAVNNSRLLDSLGAELDRADNKLQYNRDIASGDTEFQAGLKSFGRDVLGGVGRLFETGTTFESGLAEGIGSMLAGGVAAKGASIAANVAARTAAGATARAAAAATGYETAALMPATIAMMEGGSAYNSVVTEVLDMSFEDLEKNSPDFREYIKNGLSEEEARNQVAHSAGQKAALVQAPIAAATGKLVAAFEANPFGGQTFGSLIRNILNETTEEGIQSLSGEIAQNLGIKWTADETREIMQNAGAAMAQGGILGASTAGAVQSVSLPGAAVRAGVGLVTNKLDERNRATAEANASTSGLRPQDVAEAAAEFDPVAREAAKAAEPVSETPLADSVDTTAAEPIIEEKAPAFTLHSAEEIASRLSPGLRAAVSPEMTSFEALSQVVAAAYSTELHPAAQSEALITLLEEEDFHKSQIEADGVDVTDPEAKRFMLLVNNIRSSTRWGEMVERAQNHLLPESATPELIARAARVMPNAITRAQAEKALYQREGDGTPLTPEEAAALRNVVAMHDVAAVAADRLNETDGVREVNLEVMRHGGKDEWQLSAPQHIAAINKATTPKAREKAISHLRGFALSQRNKATAASVSVRQKNEGGKKAPVSYKRLGAYGAQNPTDGEITIHIGSAGSKAFGRRVAVEANMLIDLVNKVIADNPGTNVKPLPRLKEDPILFEKANQDAPIPQDEVIEEDIKEPTPYVEPEQTEFDFGEPPVKQTETKTDLDLEADIARREAKFDQEMEALAKMETPATAEKATIQSRFPSLLVQGKKQLNRFLQAFSLKDKPKSRLVEYARPLEAFVTAAQSLDALAQLSEEKPEYKLTEEKMKALSSYLSAGEDLRGVLDANLAEFLDAPYSKKDPRSRREVLLSGEVDLAAMADNRATALVETKADGSLGYNDHLIELATLAALDWYAQGHNRRSFVDAEDVASFTGMRQEDVTSDMVEAYNVGVANPLLVRNLTTAIQKFWDLKAVDTASQSYTVGVPEAIAKELILAMTEKGLLKRNETRLPNKHVAYTYTFEGNGATVMDRLRQRMGAAKNLMSDLALDPADIIRPSYGKPADRVADRQLRNRTVKLSGAQRDAVRAAQKIGFNYYENSHKLIKAAGLAAWTNAMGGTFIEEGSTRKFNAEHKKSIEGKNRTIRGGFEALNEMLAEHQAYAEAAETSVADMPVFFTYQYHKANRLQMDGAYQPQNDQSMRNVYLPTRVTVDLTNLSTADAQGFLLAAAQGLGRKTHHFNIQENADWVIQNVLTDGTPLNGRLKELQAWLRDGAKDTDGVMAEFMNSLVQTTGGVTAHGVLSMLQLAEYQNAVEDGADLSQFISHNYFEADGINNGSANAVMNFTTEVTPDFIAVSAKGGAFIGREGRTQRDQKQDKLPDMYEAASEIATQIQQHFVDNVLPSEAKPIHNALIDLMTGLGLGIKVTDKGVEISRSTMKNPMTITIYGSGIAGIAGNIAGELTNALYEALSDHLAMEQGGVFGNGVATNNGKVYTVESFWADMVTVTNSLVVSKTDRDGNVSYAVTEVPAKPSGQSMTAENFALSAEDFRILRDNVQMLLVNQMDAAIKSVVMGHVSPVTENIQKSTGAQSIIMHYRYRKEVLKALADRQRNPEKYPDYTPGEYLSRREEEEILRSIMPYGARFSTEFQNFFLGGGERSANMGSVEIDGVKVSVPQSFSRSLSRELNTASYGNMPGFAGVSGIPLAVIGTGDGRMIDYFLTDKNAPKQALVVFDGINIPVNQVVNGSVAANRAAHNSWTENPLTAFRDSFTKWVELNPLDDLLDPADPFNVEAQELLKALTRNETGNYAVKEIMSGNALKASFNTRATKLVEQADMISDRIEATKALGMTVDQMAGAASPHITEGTFLPADATDADIAHALQAEMKKAAAKRTKTEKAESRNKDFDHAFRQKGTVDRDSGAIITDIQAVNAVRTTLNNKLNNTQREMLNAAMKSLGDTNYKIVYGDPRQVRTYEKNNHPEMSIRGERGFMGKIDLVNQVIYLTNPSAETLTHELLHAATMEKVSAYYSNPKTLNETDRAAIERLEGLMNEWMLNVYDGMDGTDGQFHTAAMAEILQHSRAGRPAAALNEFMAWSLTNQEIVSNMKKMQVKHPILMVLGKALTAIKELIWGHQKAPEVGTDMFSQVRFNARVLMATPTTAEVAMATMDETVLYQSVSFGTNDRVTNLRQRYRDLLHKSFPKGISAEKDLDRLEAAKALRDAQLRVDQIAGDFGMNMQEKSTFGYITAVLQTVQGLNSAALAQAQELYDALITDISVEDFMKAGDIDPASQEYQNDYAQALDKYNALIGTGALSKDKAGRSLLLPSFLALVQTSEAVREVLGKKKLPTVKKLGGLAPDAMIDFIANTASDTLAKNASGQGLKAKTYQAAMDALAQSVLENTSDQAHFIEQHATRMGDRADDFIREAVEKTAGKAQEWAKGQKKGLGKQAGRLVNLMASLATREGSKTLAAGAISLVNSDKVNVTMREAVSEVIGRTDENAPIFDMISKVRSMVDQVRQHWREHFPRDLNAQFKRPLTQQEHQAMYLMGRADVGALLTGGNINEVLDMLSSEKARTKAMRAAEKVIMSEPDGMVMLGKARQLATYMNTGKAGWHLQPNAYAIAKINGSTDPDVIKAIDTFATLQAYELLATQTKKIIADRVESDRDAMAYAVSALTGARTDEGSKSDRELGKMNAIKGYLRADNQQGVNLLIADKTDHSALLAQGYTFIRNYVGHNVDGSPVLKGYYFSPVSGKSTFNQGVIHTVQQTVFGVNPATGMHVGAVNAGVISNPREVARIEANGHRYKDSDEALIPTYKADGTVASYMRMADPAILRKLNPNENFAEALGAWRGRQAEEMSANAVNGIMVERLHKLWTDGVREGRRSQFVRIDQSSDPIIRDAWNVLPTTTVKEIMAMFGDDGFMVPRDMVNDVIGSRSASVGDMWTGVSRWDAPTREVFRDVVTGIWGNKAYGYLVNAEKMLQGFVTDAKVLIVIKSVVVPAANLVSNVYHLSMRGIAPTVILKQMRSKTAQLNAYVRARELEMQLQNRLLAAEGRGDVVESRKLETRLQAVRDSYTRLSVWPLIENGEFSAISDAGVSPSDLAASKGDWSSFLDNLPRKLPKGPIQDAARYALVARDTSLFRIMSSGTQYGDFLAKAVLFDQLIAKGKTQKEALAEINEEFVNYNRFAGRQRAYMESIGGTWFYNFKLRSMKVAVKSLHDHPFRALVHMAMLPKLPVLGTVGSVLTDNMINSIISGKLAYSTGPGMLLRAPELNPWRALID